MNRAEWRALAALGVMALGLALAIGPGCGKESAGNGNNNNNDEVWPRQQCPGDPDCLDEGDGQLQAGAVVVDLSPSDLREGPSFIDTNSNFVYDRRDDDYTDANGNAKFDAVWISGNEFSRPATGLHDPIEGRVLALRHNRTTVVIVSVDFIGFFFDYLERIRARLGPTAAEAVDLIILTSTHNHQGPDTVGIWGRDLISSGLDPDYLDWVEGRIAQAVADAVAALAPAEVTYGAIDVQEPDGDLEPHVSDTRDPVIINNTMNVMRFAQAGGGDTIATLVNFGFHPEVMSSKNNQLSSDMVHYLRETVENGIPGEFGGIGGVTLFIQGTCGAQVGPGRVRPWTRDRTAQLSGATWERTQAVGQNLGDWALRSLDATGGAVTDQTAHLMFRTRQIFANIDNFNYQAAYRLGIFNRALYNCDPRAAFDDTNIPQIKTELVYLQIGRASLVTIPGELAPELFIGCYDGSCSGLWDIVDAGNPNPPPLGLAPTAPYLRDLLIADGSEYQWVIGLGQDLLGYILPNYNYQLHPTSPWAFEADGDHYEETNSLGPSARDQLIGPLEELITYEPTP